LLHIPLKHEPGAPEQYWWRLPHEIMHELSVTVMPFQPPQQY